MSWLILLISAAFDPLKVTLVLVSLCIAWKPGKALGERVVTLLVASWTSIAISALANGWVEAPKTIDVPVLIASAVATALLTIMVLPVFELYRRSQVMRFIGPPKASGYSRSRHPP